MYTQTDEVKGGGRNKILGKYGSVKGKGRVELEDDGKGRIFYRSTKRCS